MTAARGGRDGDPIMAHNKEAPPEEEKGESAPLWIISFADLVTLMLSFFVILAAGDNDSPASEPKLTELAAAIRTAFKYLPPADSKDPIDLQILLKKLRGPGKGGAGRKGEASQPRDGTAGIDDRVTTIRTGVQTTIGTTVLFDRDSVALSPEMLTRLAEIADRMRGHTNVFLIKGHTSRDEEYRWRGSGRDLAYERANAVASRLIEIGVAKECLRTASCRDYEPRVKPAYSEAAHSANRRAEVIATEQYANEGHGESPGVEVEIDGPAGGR